MSLGNRLLDTVDNPFYVAGGPGFFGTKTVARNQLLRPYPQYTDVFPLFSSGSSSTYHALQVYAQKSGTAWVFQFEGRTRGRRASTTGRRSSRTATDSPQPVDHRSRRAAPLHPELRLRAALRPRQAFGSSASRFVDTFLGGWMIDGITNYPERHSVRRFRQQRVPVLQPGVIREFKRLQREAPRAPPKIVWPVVRHEASASPTRSQSGTWDRDPPTCASIRWRTGTSGWARSSG